MRFSSRVTVVEVGPRDGLQSLSRVYSAETKAHLIEAVAASGVQKIEVGSFVRPEVVPQLADTEAVLSLLKRRPGRMYRALVPNRRGAERAVAAGVDEIVALITASETYNRRNQNMTIAESLNAVEEIVTVASREGTPVVGAVGLALFCPYEGPISIPHTAALIAELEALGVGEAYVASSVGVDGPRQLAALCNEIGDRCDDLRLGVHLHNANGMGFANVLAALDAGVSVVESAICGIGGGTSMPAHAPLPGNISTEDLVQMLDEMEIECGIDPVGIVDAAVQSRDMLELGPTHSYALRGGTRRQVLALTRT